MTQEPHPDLLLIEQAVYKPAGLTLQNLKIEEESAEYGAAEFMINHQIFKFRIGKITPTKTGQFVTFWKRLGKGPIQPYDSVDPFDFLVVGVRFESRFGLFTFSKKILCEKGVLSTEQREGKRAIRIYPAWDKAESPQARKTQAWQLEWFTEII